MEKNAQHFPYPESLVLGERKATSWKQEQKPQVKETSNKHTPELWSTLIQWQEMNTGKNCQDMKFSLGSLKWIQ